MASQAVKKTVAPKTEAVAALEAEATGADEISVKFRGDKYTIDPNMLDDYVLMQQLSSGMPFMLLEALVPDGAELSKLLGTCDKSPAGNPKLSSVMEMVHEFMEAIGAGK